jgi:hypothetical protein
MEVDISGDEQETIYIRTAMKGVVKERFLNISTPNSTKSLDLFENVMQVFKENNINESMIHYKSLTNSVNLIK